MKKTEYDNQPERLAKVGNGSYLYRWDIEAIEKENPEGTAHTMYECFEVLVWDEPNAKKVIEAVIEAMWPPSVEAKLINDYNAANENVLSEDFKQQYLSFIIERNKIKEEIKTFFNEII
jgi:hypothetical protein